MRIINDPKATESFLSDKLLSAQLDSFRVFNHALDLYLLIEVNGELENRCVSFTGDISIFDEVCIHSDFPEIVKSVYKLIGQRITLLNIDNDCTLVIYFDEMRLIVRLDSDSSEIIWSVTPEVADLYDNHDWSVVLTDESDLVVSMNDVE